MQFLTQAAERGLPAPSGVLQNAARSNDASPCATAFSLLPVPALATDPAWPTLIEEAGRLATVGAGGSGGGAASVQDIETDPFTPCPPRRVGLPKGHPE